jgi:hypothetical protein
MGVSSKPTGALDSPIRMALDTGKIRQFERGAAMQKANPEMQIDLPGVGRVGFDRPLTDEEKAQQTYDSAMRLEQGKRQLASQDAKTKAEAEAAAKAAKVKTLVDSGIDPKRAVRIVELEAKYGDVEETPSVIATKRGQDISAATARRSQDLSAQRSEDTSGRNEMASGLQAMGVARASSSLNLLKTNTQLMDKFEQKVLDGKAQITASQLELARKALSGQTGSAYAEKTLAEGIPMLMEKNPELLRYVRAAKGISGAVREITPRGGSNMMMQMEQTLAGIGPAGTDPESINQVRIFRNDILNGVQEGVNAMRTKTPQDISGAAPQTTRKWPGG